ncbi:MAG TPA: hypothetical protein VLF89_05820 [Candidatus Saccharimonadales bacterium]|nr:hypothetical protein [Candidatus Saccharimonadales bacterium]
MDKNDTNKQNSTLVNTVIKGGYFNVTPKPSEAIMTNGSWGTAMPTITPPYEKRSKKTI